MCSAAFRSSASAVRRGSSGSAGAASTTCLARVRDAGLALMRRIDELHLDYPFAGSRILQGLLKQEGIAVGRLHVATLMKRMGIEALYRRPNTSKPAPRHDKPVSRGDSVLVYDRTVAC